MEEYYDIINIVYIYSERSYGTIEQLGAFASMVKYQKDGIDLEVLLENDEFAIVDEIVFHHIEEKNE